MPRTVPERSLPASAKTSDDTIVYCGEWEITTGAYGKRNSEDFVSLRERVVQCQGGQVKG